MKEFFINFKLDSRMKIMLLKWKLDWWKKSSSTSSWMIWLLFHVFQSKTHHFDQRVHTRDSVLIQFTSIFIIRTNVSDADIHLGILRDVIPRRQAMAVRISVWIFMKCWTWWDSRICYRPNPGRILKKSEITFSHTNITLQPYTSPPGIAQMPAWPVRPCLYVPHRNCKS